MNNGNFVFLTKIKSVSESTEHAKCFKYCHIHKPHYINQHHLIIEGGWLSCE